MGSVTKNSWLQLSSTPAIICRDVNSTDNTSPGTIARTSSHYRGSPCAPAQSPQQIRPVSETKRSGGSDVATGNWLLNVIFAIVVFACDDLCTLCYAWSAILNTVSLHSTAVDYCTVQLALADQMSTRFEKWTGLNSELCLSKLCTLTYTLMPWCLPVYYDYTSALACENRI